MLRCLIAKIYFKHTTITSFIDEMHRNPALREVCHFIPYTRNGKWYYTPSHSDFSRFYKKLFQHKEELQHIFQQLVEAKLLSDDEFAKYVAHDGK